MAAILRLPLLLTALPVRIASLYIVEFVGITLMGVFHVSSYVHNSNVECVKTVLFHIIALVFGILVRLSGK